MTTMRNVSQGYKQKKKLEKDAMSIHDFSEWFNLIKEHTFESISIIITKDEALAIVRLYHHRVNNGKSLSDVESKHLHNFQSKINQILSTRPDYTNDGCFVRLSSRSPKDATMFEPYLTHTKQRMYDNLTKMLLSDNNNTNNNNNNNSNVMSKNTLIIAFFQACVDGMKVHNSDEIISLLANSERVLTDLNTWIFGDINNNNNNNNNDNNSSESKKEEEEEDEKKIDDDDNFGMSLIIRKWHDIEIGTEYRGFVGKNGELNGLCQYYNFLYFPFVVKRKQIICDKIVNFYNNNLKDIFQNAVEQDENCKLLPCVIDFVILNQSKIDNDNDNDININSLVKVKVIELNMFHDYSNTVKISSGSEMFSWKDDKSILLNGPFEFRIHEKPVQDSWVRKFMNPDWEDIISDVVTKYNHDQQSKAKQKQQMKTFGLIFVIVLVIIVAIIVAFYA